MGNIIEMLIRALPYPEQMTGIEVAENAVEFTWRTRRYRVTKALGVDEVGDGVLIGSDRAILLRQCLQLQQATRVERAKS